MVSIAVAISALLVVGAVVMTVIRWREEGRRVESDARTRRTAVARARLGASNAPARKAGS
jgi:hypothetical protein